MTEPSRITRTREHPLGWPNALPPNLTPCRVDTSKGKAQHRCSGSHASMVETYRAYRDHLNEEAEAWAIGYATETETYWREVRPGERPNLPRFLTMWRGESHELPEDDASRWDDAAEEEGAA